MLDRSIHNAHKVAYIVKSYPDKNIKEIGEMFEMSVIEFNAAVWRAEEFGLIEMAATKTGEVRFAKEPDIWEFGPDVEVLIQDIPYILKKFAESESDLESNYFGN